jgi:hypothetical protein
MLPPDSLVVLESLVIHQITGLTIQDGIVRLSDLNKDNRRAVMKFQTYQDLARDLKAAADSR